MAKFLYITLLLALSINLKANDFLTHFEKSNFLETPRYEETYKYCKELSKSYPKLKLFTFGKLPSGREMFGLIWDSDRQFNPENSKKSGKAILMITAAIHAGESDGKDAGMMLLRDITQNKINRESAKNTTIIFIPILNPDGHEYYRKNSRINQNGPDSCGWRTNANNLNLNRDFLKVDSYEIRYLINLYNKWLPDFEIDCHSSDGADYQYHITYILENHGNMPKNITDWQNQVYLPKLEQIMNKKKYLMFPYVSFRQWHNPRSGLYLNVAPPRLSHGYFAIRNRMSLCIETHALKNYKTRVFATYEMISATLDILSTEYKKINKIFTSIDNEWLSGNMINKYIPVSFKLAKDSTMIKFKGMEYKAEKSDITKGDWFIYDNSKPIVYDIPLFSNNIVADSALIPNYYFIPAEWTEVISRLDYHGVKYSYLKEDKTYKINSFKLTEPKWSTEPYEGRIMIRNLQKDVISEERFFPKGTIIVDTRQINALVAVHLLEPSAPDNLILWGFFNSIFEQKEYAETYVMERKLREMLAESPELKDEFDKKLKEDKEFSESQWAIVNWFYRKTEYWDTRLYKYPVAKYFGNL